MRDQHSVGVEKIRSRNLSIAEAVLALVDLYSRLYGVDAYGINCGKCEDFAADLLCLFPDATMGWGGEFTNNNDDQDRYAYHCIVRYGGKFYNSQHPNGVDDFRRISAFGSN